MYLYDIQKAEQKQKPSSYPRLSGFLLTSEIIKGELIS